MEHFVKELTRAARCVKLWRLRLGALAQRRIADTSNGANGSADAARAISQILELNPTASPLFLAQFPAGALGDYLDNLISAATPRGSTARRVRAENSRGVLARSAAA
jgi:hypothetical protein